jgi:hypothetical protein
MNMMKIPEIIISNHRHYHNRSIITDAMISIIIIIVINIDLIIIIIIIFIINIIIMYKASPI